MISCQKFYHTLLSLGVDFFAGVPDSLLKNFCAFVSDNTDERKHIIAANEGAAIALATGHYLATEKISLVYMQNSGLGNCVNPLLSLADQQVYSIPMLLMIGWRGEPGVPDEPQHLKQGAVTLELLDTLGIPYAVLPPEQEAADELVSRLIQQSLDEQRAVALVVKKNTFSKYQASVESHDQSVNLGISRERAIQTILGKLGSKVRIVASTGMISREVFEHRKKQGEGHHQDFLTVGSMGHCSQIAYAVANANTDQLVCCIDGDGSALMHMGSMAVMGQYRGGNLLHIVINNGKHDSVGGQPTVAFDISLTKIAEGCGYEACSSASNEEEIEKSLDLMTSNKRMSFLEIRVLPGARADLGRPTLTPKENRDNFIHHCQSE